MASSGPPEPKPEPPAPERAHGPPPRTMTQRLRRVVDIAVAVERRADGTLRREIRYPVVALRVLLQVVRQWARDRCPMLASSLAFSTILSLVPLLAIALALLRATGAFEAQSSLVTFLSQQVLPVSREEIAGYFLTWAGNLTFKSAGIVGLATTLVISFILYSSVEKIFNFIWRSESRRSLAQKFVVFYALVTIVPALMGFSLYHAARYGLTTGWSGAFASLGAVWGALFCANKLLPLARVSTRAALIGSFVSAIAFEVAKHAFQLYVAKVAFRSYAGVYGTLGLVPIVFIWIYYAWLVILLGAEVAHTTQNLHHLERLTLRRPMSAERELFEQVNGVVAARLLCAVVEAYRAGGKALTAVALAARFDLDEGAVERIFRRLKDHGLAIEVHGEVEGYLPGRPPSEITLADVLDPFRGSDVFESVPSGPRTPVDAALAEVVERSRDAARVTLEELTRPRTEPQ